MNAYREEKININIEPIDGLHMDDYDFECAFYVSENRKVTVPKSKMIKVDENNYLALITSDMRRAMGKGDLNVRIIVRLPDDDFDDGYRTDVAYTKVEKANE